MENKNKFKLDGSYIRTLREKKGLTQDQVAEILGCHVSYVSAMENGKKSNPGVAIVTKLAELYGMSFKEFIREENPNPKQITVDLIQELHKADRIRYEGIEIPLDNEQVSSRIETGIRMGIIYALDVLKNKNTPTDQAWFWTKEWQQGMQDAETDLKEGKIKIYESVEELADELKKKTKNKS